MARGMPSSESTLLLHPTLSLSLAAVWVAASIVVLASVCASCHRKPATSTPKSPKGSLDDKSTSQEQEQDEQEQYDPPIAEDRITELEAAIHGPIYPASNCSSVTASKRRLSVSMSITPLKEGLARIKTKKEGRHEKAGGEESLWKKKIILGEKSKMQNDDCESGGDQEKNGGTQSQQLSRSTTTYVSTEGRAQQLSRSTSFVSAKGRARPSL